MANVVYRGKSITFPDGMSEAEIAQAMPSIADQIDTDFLNESSAQKTPEKKESFSDKAVSLAKDAAGYIKKNALKLPVAIAKELKSNSVVDGMDGVSVKANQESESTLKKVLDKNKKPNNLQEGSEVVDGIAGVAKVGLNRGYAGLGKIEAGLVKSLADLTGSEKLADIAESQNKYANEIENRAVLRGSPVEGFAKESIVQDLPEAGSNAISSVIQTAPALAIGAASGGSALPALFGGVGLQEYNEGREKDLSPFQSATRAVPMAVAEVVGEKLGGFDKIAKGLRQATKGNGVADLGAAMLESSLKELPAEELTTTLQFLVDKTPGIGLNQDATFDDYKKAVKDTALATILQSGGMGAGGAVLTNIANKLDAPVGTQEAAEIDQQLLNAFNASQQIKQDQLQQAEADTALANITSPDATIDDAIALAEKATDVPTAKPTGLLSAVSEAIPASDILGDENVSTDLSGTTGIVDSGSIANELDNSGGSAVVTGDGVNATGSPINRESAASDIPAGTGSTGNDTLNRPFAQATDDFLPKMRSMTTDQTIIKQIDEELARRGMAEASKNEIAPVTTAEPVAQPAKLKTAKEVADAFKAQTGDSIDIARTKMAGAALRNMQRESGNLEGELEGNPYTAEQMALIEKHEGFKKKSNNLFHITKTDNLASIAEKGLITDAPRRYEGVSGDGKISLAANEETARVYGAPEDTMLRVKKDYKFDDLESDLLAGGEGSYTTGKNIPPEALEVKQGSKWIPLLDAQKKAPKAAKPKAVKPKTLLATLRDLGGVAITEKQDITGEVRGFAAGGYNQIFKSTSKRSMKGLIESGDLDEYLPYNMRLESNGANDDAFDSTEAYDYLADKIRNGESVLPYAVVEEAQANQYYQDAGATVESDVQEAAELLTEDEINEQLRQATNEERETATEARVINTERENGDTGSGERSAATTQTNASQQAEVTNSNTDLLGDNTTAKQAVADAERAKDAKRNSGNDNQDTFTLTGSNSEADQAAAAGAQSLFDAPKSEPEVQNKQGLHFNNGVRAFKNGEARVLPSYFTEKSGKNAKDWYRGWDSANIDAPIEAETKTSDTQKAKDDTRFANNKIFTADKVAAARARLKSKLNTLNSGIDPELMMDGITIAGAYLETGVRKFSDYAKAMTEDFGDSIKPYLLSFYEAARAYPGIDKEGMTDQETAASEHQALLTPAVLAQAKEVIGQGVVSTPKSKAKPNGQLKLTQDWGVDDINGYDSDRDDGRGGEVKTAFLDEGKKYLNQVAKLLEAEGFEPHKDQRGRLQKAVSVNEGGIATSGEVSLTMRKGNAGVYVNVGTSAIRGLTGNHPQGVSVMIRATGNADTDRYANKGQNIWLSTDLSSTELANKLMQTAERYVKNTEQAEQGNQNARANQTEQVQPRGTQSDLLTEQPRDSDSEPMDARVGGSSEGADASRNVQRGISETSGSGATSTSGSNGNESPSGSRKTSNDGNTGSTANVDNFEITDNTSTGEGSISQKYANNIAAIKIIKTLDAEKRLATPEEREQLAKYAGFGALAGAFDKNNTKFAKEYAELKELLTTDEYEAARASILNAYFTSPTIVKTMYEAIAQIGFKNGRVLEPSMGSGNFFGMMPATMRNKSSLNGVELDVITSRIAKHLYPKANVAVATGFQDYEAPEGYFDLVISNPPFGSEKITDTAKRGYSGFSIHNYFIAKSIDKLREGGVMAVVVSHSFMDAQNSQAREWISKRANLLGAVRLPKEAFKDIAGTEVITDILYFQKTSTPKANPDWINSTNNGDYSFNDYFYANPRNVLGRIVDTTNQFGKTFTIESLSGNGTLSQQLKAFNERLPQGVYVEPSQRVEVLDSADNTVPDGVKVGTFYKDSSGVIRQRIADMLGAKRSQAWEVPSAKAQERMEGMMALRDLLRNQMRLERDPMATEKDIEANRKQLNTKYDAFLKEFGYLNSMTNRRLFLDDTESALVQALEMDYDAGVTKAKALSTGMEAKEPSAQKADIFKRRVLFPPSDSITVNNAQDALLQSLDAKGIVDIDYMAEVYNKPANQIISELGELVYNDPQKGLVTADEYLSGDVKTKLDEAKKAALTDSKLNRNVEALEQVIPKDKLPSEIFASPGANWIPADVYESFASEITGIPKEAIEFNYVSAAATWLTDKTRSGDAGKMTSDYGTDDLNSFQLFTLLVNGRSAEVKKSVSNGEGGTKQVVDIGKTDAANAKYQKIKELWSSWVFSDPERADRLASIYNDKHNRIVARKFDGSHMNFYGMSPSIKLIASQKNVVWRAIQDRNVLFDHVVGAGKTFAMAATAMEMKRLGISRKPMFVVPNHLTLQWRSEFTRLYPASNILAATPEDFAKDKREKMFSKMVTGGYDAIIIGHSSLTKVGLPAEIEERMYNEQVKEIADAIEQAKTARGDRGVTRAMEQIKQNIENKIKKLKEKAGAKDNVVTWDELGIDGLFIDEMHEFKNLFFTTQMQRTAGLGNPAGSGKALDLFMKVRHMQQTIGENAPLITATGTPVSNSLAEMFTMQRYMKYDHMKRSDLHLFDAWAKQYGEIENVYEVAPSGVGYRQSTRFSKFKNLPSLMANYTSFADVITLQDLKDQSASQGKVFPVPKIASGRPINVIAQRSELQRDYFGIPKLDEDEAGNIKFELDIEKAGIGAIDDGKYRLSFENGFKDFDTRDAAALELVTKSLMPKTYLDPESLLGKFANLKELTQKTKGKINALSLTGLANKAGLDFRIINPSAPDFAGSKINLAVGNMVSLWKDTAKDKGTQIVFCDMSVPASARASAASKERYALVRDRNSQLIHKKATLHTAEGFEGFPFYIVESGSKDSKSFAVYEPLSGLLLREGMKDKQSAKEYMANLVSTDNGRDSIFAIRDRNETITKDDIDEYFAEQEKIEIADDGGNLITPDDLESIAGSSQFSVYDDIKAKLIARGVPEVEIAFIHDYNTPKQKEELFKRVNRGEVRFLFGSTPKLGAGTNVQKRLVGLHHIDAPWRPSDLEQREGRIIRQGNELYARDPDNFEVSIWRYATEQTYDTRRWQLLEHKASGIEQLRKYSGESEIEDVAGEASNSADMKAAASGNPLVLEETKLRTEVKRLQNLEKAHADSKFSMLRKIRQNEGSINEYYPRNIAKYEDMISLANQNPIPSDKDKVALTIVDGQRLTDREKTENAIGSMATRVRQAFNMGDVKVINYRGIEFTVERGISVGMLKLMSPSGHMHTYLEKDNFSPSGLITRFNNYIDSLESRIEQAKAQIAVAEKENSELQPRLNDPFEQADLLKKMQARHDSVKRKLMKSTQIEAVPENQRNKFNSLLEQRRNQLIEAGYEDVLKKAEAEDDDVPMFTRNNKLATGLPKEAIQRAVNVLRRNWKNAPEIIVVQDMSDPAIREAVREENDRQLSQGAEGQPEGFFDAGKVYIVASEMNTPDDLIRVVFHETLGHYGLRGLYGKELGGILDRVAMLRKRDMAKKAKQYGLDLTKKSDVRIIAEEVLAEMAQTAPEASFVKRAIAAIRQFLRDIGVKLELTDNDIIANYLLPARNYVTQGAQQRGLVGNLSTAFNRDNSTTTAQLFKELTLNDDMFKYPKSNAADMQEVFNEVAPGLLHIEKSKSFDDEVSELYSVYPIDASGNPIRSKVGFINVYDDGKVEINVSSLGEGFGGSRIYAAVGNWAYNNGKVFAGDREGISPAGISRRLENMISLALKFGTTDHIMPHKDQMNDLGFDWKEGDTEYNLAEMLKASFNAIRNGVYVKTENFGIELTEKSNDAKGVSKLDDLVYDFDKHQFTDLSNGKPYTTGDFDKLASTAEARAAYAGRTTLQRAALGNTFMGATREGKQFLLEQLGKLSLQPLQLTDPQLAGVFYSRSTPQTETPQFKAWFGNSKVVDADGKPLVVYHGTDADFNSFDVNKTESLASLFKGAFFTEDTKEASDYAKERAKAKGGNANVMPVYISLKNPLVLTRDTYSLTNIKNAMNDNKHDGVILLKEDGSVRYVIAKKDTQIKSAIGNNGNFDANNNDIRFSRTASPQGRLTPQWQVDETSKMDNVIRALQDKYIDLKRVTQEIKKAGNDISDRWNAYLQEELYHGRSANRVQDFIKQDLTPLIEDMRMRGVGMADFEEYLWMRHAPERNEQIAKINPDMPDGGAGVTTAEAESYMDGLNPADKKKYEALAKHIDAITAKSRQVLVDYGLESQSTVNAWQSAYEFYVPLMREDMERGTGNGTGSGFKVKGNSSKRAMGSNRAVVDVIANIAQQYEKNIVRGEKNRVATAMIGLAKLNPNEEFWNVETPPTIRHVSKATGLVETRTDPNYKNRNNVIVARIVNKRGEIEERSVTFNEFNDRAMKMALSLNNLDVDQVSAVSNFMGNITRYFSSINTQYNPIFGIVNITRDTQGAILNLSTTELAGKQKEVLANIMPALRGIYAETRTDNGIKSPMQFGSFTAAQKSKAQAMRALWEEYQREGGTTGFRDMYANAEERTKAVSKALDPNWWTKTLAGKVVTVGGVLTVPETVLKDKAIKPVFDWLSDYNQTLENAVRLAAYKVAIDSGISKQQAASIGKNLTVNFNRKGAYTRTMGSWYAFFNAAVQGTARIGETLTGPKGKQIIAGGISIGVAQALMLAMAGFDEDEPPEFVRSSNFIIPIPNTDQKYITIPMPLGFNVLPNFGRITTEWALSGAENTTERVFDIFGAVMESFNPLGGNGRIDSIIMPTVADPFNDLSKNEDWTGRNIAQEDFSNLRPTPGYTRTRDKATELSIELARWINNLSGGDDYEKGQLSPTGDQIEYLTGQLTGGVGREFVKSVNTIESIVTGEDLPTYKIPLVGRFVGNSAGQAPQAGKFYNNLIKLNKLEAGYLGRLKDGKDADTFLNENPELNYVDYGKKAQSAISKLRDYKRDLVKEGANREEVKLVDEQITLIMTEFNQTVKPETTNP